jgi:hypothetical protein
MLVKLPIANSVYWPHLLVPFSKDFGAFLYCRKKLDNYEQI